MQDLAAYTVTVTDAWAVPLGEYQMYIPPPPAGGIILSLILNIMKGLWCTQTAELLIYTFESQDVLAILLFPCVKQ